MSDEISKRYRKGDHIASVIQQNPLYHKGVDCPACEGTGLTGNIDSREYYPSENCKWCNGTGRKPYNYKNR